MRWCLWLRSKSWTFSSFACSIVIPSVPGCNPDPSICENERITGRTIFASENSRFWKQATATNKMETECCHLHLKNCDSTVLRSIFAKLIQSPFLRFSGVLAKLHGRLVSPKDFYRCHNCFQRDDQPQEVVDGSSLPAPHRGKELPSSLHKA